MSIATSVQNDVCKDGQVDRCVDVQIDGRKAVGKDGSGAFVIVLANHKGGVTKTTSTANLAVMLAEAGRRVLIVDCDPQANLSEAFGWYSDIPGERLEDLVENPDAATATRRRSRCSRTSCPNCPGASGSGSSRPPTRSLTLPRTSPARPDRGMSCACDRCSNRCA